MPKTFKRILTVMVWLACLAFIYIYRQPIIHIFQRLKAQALPCREPVTYSIGSFDKRFGISRQDFLKAIAQAEQIWEKPVQRQLFAYADTGALKINLLYDARQAATAKLQQLGLAIHDDQAGYDQLKLKYGGLQASYQQQKTAFEKLVAIYTENKQAYDAEVTYWNQRGGAPKEEFDKLEQKRLDLNARADQVNQAQRDLNVTVDTLNNMVTVLNRLASSLNVVADKYNTIGASQGQEFEEGVYTSDVRGNQINIYQFDDQGKLVRVLAHEMGHALGLEHVENPAAIMYRLNNGKNEKLTADDIAALKKRCGI